eukprot:m51a1_g4121 hypothetical protein (654) ;mRNA; r:159367-162246
MQSDHGTPQRPPAASQPRTPTSAGGPTSHLRSRSQSVSPHGLPFAAWQQSSPPSPSPPRSTLCSPRSQKPPASPSLSQPPSPSPAASQAEDAAANVNNVRVVLRVRHAPTLAGEGAQWEGGPSLVSRGRPETPGEQDKGKRCVGFLEDGRSVTIEHNSVEHLFKFSRVLTPSSTQQDVFDDIGAPLVQAVINGFNAAIIAYGPTGSGKTYTMMGYGFTNEEAQAAPVGDLEPTLRGVIPRMMESVFEGVAQQTSVQAVEYTVRTSFIEIYKEVIYDLLSIDKEPLNIRQRPDKRLWLPTATEIPVSSAAECLRIFNRGNQNRVIASTKVHRESSRSHAIFLVTVERFEQGSGITRFSQLYMVDLAGCEKVARTGAVGERLDEAKTINKSLLALGQVIFALSSDKALPRRTHKSLSAMRFGDRSQKIRNKTKPNCERSAAELSHMLDQANEVIAQQAEKIVFQQQKPGGGGLPDVFHFLCPLSKRVMVDPVIACDGYSYQRDAIEAFFRASRGPWKSPVSGCKMTTTALVPNRNLRSQIFLRAGSEPKSLNVVFFDFVPDNVLAHVFCMLPLVDLLAVGAVCKRWLRVSRADGIWAEMSRRYLPAVHIDARSLSQRALWALFRQLYVRLNGPLPTKPPRPKASLGVTLFPTTKK